MSESAAAAGNDEKKELEETKQSVEEPALDDAEEEEEEDEEDGDGNFVNNHDLIGVQGIIAAQKNEIEKKKVSLSTLYFYCVTDICVRLGSLNFAFKTSCTSVNTLS